MRRELKVERVETIESALRAMPRLSPAEARFWAYVDIVDDDSTCWEWRGGLTSEGYGTFAWSDGPLPNRTGGAHRFAFFFANGVVPDVTCHHCDNPPCVRPSHLFAGDHLANIADRTKKGRTVSPRGSAHGNAKLTEAIVLRIREAHATGDSGASLAARYGVSNQLVSEIVRGMSWRHVGGPTRGQLARTLCTVESCGRVSHARGWCRTHYSRWVRWGRPVEEPASGS